MSAMAILGQSFRMLTIALLFLTRLHAFKQQENSTGNFGFYAQINLGDSYAKAHDFN